MLSFLGEFIGAPFTSNKPLVIVSDTDPISLDIIELLGFRLSNVEYPVYVALTGSKGLSNDYYKKDQIFSKGKTKREMILSLIKNFPNITFRVSDKTVNTFDLAEVGLIRDSSSYNIIYLNCTPSDRQQILFSGNSHFAKSYTDSDQNRLYKISYGVDSQGRIGAGFEFNYRKSYITENNVEFQALTRPTQVQGLKLLVSMMVNAIISNNRVNFSTLYLEDGNVVKDPLVIPKVSFEEAFSVTGQNRFSNDFIEFIESNISGATVDNFSLYNILVDTYDFVKRLNYLVGDNDTYANELDVVLDSIDLNKFSMDDDTRGYAGALIKWLLKHQDRLVHNAIGA